MRPIEHRKLAVGAAFAALVLLLPLAISGKAKPQPCPASRFLLPADEGSLVAGEVTPLPDAVIFDEVGGRRRLAIGSGCAPVAVRPRVSRGGTTAKAKWKTCGQASKVRLSVRIPTGCATLTGTLKARGAPTRRFTARVSLCGDGVVDAGGGEACDEGHDCEGDLACVMCACTAAGSSTTVPTGTSSTSSSLHASTSSTTSTTVSTSTTSVSITLTTTSTSSSSSSVPTTSSTSTTSSTTSSSSTLPGTPPPDPSTVAPPPDAGVATDFAAATAFLYTTSGIQTGVVPGTIDPRRVVVLRGRILERDGTALPGVRVTVHAHPELGQTLSRTDGRFDLAANGGGTVTVEFAKDGFLPVQRGVDVPWRDWVAVSDVVLVPEDGAVTAVDLGVPDSHVARGSVVSDADGTRQATVLFPAGTTATKMLPGGTTEPMAMLHVRATEYTVGASGPAAMPAVLPSASAYTYAVELTADEVDPGGGASVRFDPPLQFYVEAPVAFPAGTLVPAGYYDRTLARWIASENGLVVTVVSVAGGVAALDTDGDGLADDPATLAALGVTADEQQRLATLYAPGQRLWRMPVPHFTAWDYNFAFSLPDDAIDPGGGGGGGGGCPNCRNRKPRNGDDDRPDDPCKQGGSIIDCHAQVLREGLPLVGLPFGLHYASDRVPGRATADTVDIELSGDDLPASVRAIHLKVEVAGRMFEQLFPPTKNLKTTFSWDHLDAYGRPLTGRQPAIVSIGYEYVLQYTGVSGALGKSLMRVGMFGASAGIGSGGGGGGGGGGAVGILDLTLGNARAAAPPAILWQTWDVSLGAWDARAYGLGGWTLGVHHAYDPYERVVLRGDGERRGAGELDNAITTIVGTSAPGVPGSLDTRFAAIGPDGSIYTTGVDLGSGHAEGRVWRRGPDGTYVLVAGGGTQTADGIPALSAGFDVVGPIALGPDTSVYFACYLDDAHNGGIAVCGVAPDGTFRKVAGGNGYGGAGEGGPATAAQIDPNLQWIAVGPDDSLYLPEPSFSRIRRVGPDGIIRTVAGAGPPCGSSTDACGDGNLAIGAGLLGPNAVAVGPDGSLYIADSGMARVRRVGPNGIITNFAGNGNIGNSGDGFPAPEATIEPAFAIAVAPDGSVYFSSLFLSSRIRRVGPDRIITTFAGTGSFDVSGDDGPPQAAAISTVRSMAIGPDGTLYLGASPSGEGLLRQVAPVLPGFAVSDLVVPSDRGDEVFVFSGSGRHLRTLDPLTGGVRWEFEYDAAGRLAAARDGDGNVTTIEHDATGAPVAIVAPGGQRTTLATNPDGYLASAMNPAGERVQLTYYGGTADGLLATLTDARGATHEFAYDAAGRLTRDQDPAGGDVRLARTETTLGYTVALTKASGLTTTYEVERLADGRKRSVRVDPTGARTEVVNEPDGTSAATFPDGIVVATTQGPAPRWGLKAPMLETLTRTLPSGKSETIASSHSATLADPRNPLSVQALATTLTRNGHTFTTSYDGSTRAVTTTSPGGHLKVLTLDAQGRPAQIAITPGAVDPVTISRDGKGRFASVVRGDQVLTYAYDARSRLASRTDALTRVVAYTYDAADRTSRLTFPSSFFLGFGYDANGNRSRITMPSGAEHQRGYTPIDLESSYTPPGNASYTTAFDSDRRRVSFTLPSGRTMTTGFDAGGRLASMTTPEAVVTFAYGAGDPTDRVRTITRTPTGGGAATTVAYGFDGGLVTSAGSGGAAEGTFTYGFNADLLPESITLESGADTVATAIGWDADGRVTTYGPFTFTRDGPGGAATAVGDGAAQMALTYDTLARVATRTHTVGAAAIYAIQIEHDAAGRVSRAVETLGGTPHTTDFAYDADGQLVQVMRDGSVAETYTYDANGNRTSRRLGAGAAETATYDAQDRLQQRGSVTYGFDVDGFLAARDATGFTYGTRGELLAAGAVTYAYDGLGRRVARTVGSDTTQYLYGNPSNPFQLSASRAPDGTLTVYYYDDLGYLIAFDRGTSRFYVGTDQVGSPRVVADAAGSVVKRRDYDAFGVVLADTAPAFDLVIGYGGGLDDPTTGLVRFGLRDYEPRTGRWTARDPVLFAGGQANLYVYVRNDPASRRDPTGLFCVGGSVYEIIGGGVSVCYDDKNGMTFCSEVGFGIGDSFDISSEAGEGTTDTGLETVLAGELGCGPAKVGFEATVDRCGKNTFKSQIGPFTSEGDKTTDVTDIVGAKPSTGRLGPKIHCGGELKMAARGCVASKF